MLKPRFFGSHAGWADAGAGDGFFVAPDGIHGRFAGHEVALLTSDGALRYAGPGFDLELDPADPASPRGGTVEDGVEVDLTYFHILRWLRDAVLAGSSYLTV